MSTGNLGVGVGGGGEAPFTAKKNPLFGENALLPIKARVLRQIAPESSPESSAKSLSQKFFGVPFLSLRWCLLMGIFHLGISLSPTLVPFSFAAGVLSADGSLSKTTTGT